MIQVGDACHGGACFKSGGHACRRNLAATFRSHILNSRDADNIVNHTPVRVLGSCSFMYMRQGDVYILGVTKTNANVMMAFRFMTNVSPSPGSVPPESTHTAGTS